MDQTIDLYSVYNFIMVTFIDSVKQRETIEKKTEHYVLFRWVDRLPISQWLCWYDGSFLLYREYKESQGLLPA